jgi:RNA polymerase sigma-70 factor, ECF subfamily
MALPRIGPVQQTEAPESGSRARWEAVYRDNVDWVYRYIFGRVGNRPDADDATGEVFTRALVHLNLSASPEQVRAYLAATIRSVLVDHWRTQYGLDLRAAAALAGDPGQSLEPGDTPAHANARRASRILAQLPERYRRVLELRFLTGYSVAETARALGVSVVSARVLQHRALRRAAELERERTA